MNLKATNQFSVKNCKNQMKYTFKMKNLEKSKWILKMNIHINIKNKNLLLNQDKYMCLSCFNKSNYKGVRNFFATYLKSFKAQCPINVIGNYEQTYVFDDMHKL